MLVRTYVRKTEWNRMDASVCYPFSIRAMSVQGPFNSCWISVFLKWSTVAREMVHFLVHTVYNKKEHLKKNLNVM